MGTRRRAGGFAPALCAKSGSQALKIQPDGKLESNDALQQGLVAAAKADQHAAPPWMRSSPAPPATTLAPRIADGVVPGSAGERTGRAGSRQCETPHLPPRSAAAETATQEAAALRRRR